MIVRTRRPIARVRGTRFGGSLESGSHFGGVVTLNMMGLDKLEQTIAGPRIEQIAKPIGERVLDIAKENVHVITGELRDSGYVRTEVEGARVTVDVGFSANHAAPEEFGISTQNRPAHPYLRPAWDEVVGSGDAKQDLRDGMAILLSEI